MHSNARLVCLTFHWSAKVKCSVEYLFQFYIFVYSFIFLYHIFIDLHAHTLFSFHSFFIFSCIPAFPPVNASARNAFCIFYEHKGEFCKNITRSLYVYGDQSTLDYGEREAVNFEGYFDVLEIAPECRIPFKDLFCHHSFPQCDESLAQPEIRRTCRRSCEYLQVVCKREMVLIRDIPAFQRYVDLSNCSSSKFASANGGDAPECYQWYDLPGKYCNVIINSSIWTSYPRNLVMSFKS